jgi:hypothetical protein
MRCPWIDDLFPTGVAFEQSYIRIRDWRHDVAKQLVAGCQGSQGPVFLLKALRDQDNDLHWQMEQ